MGARENLRSPCGRLVIVKFFGYLLQEAQSLCRRQTKNATGCVQGIDECAARSELFRTLPHSLAMPIELLATAMCQVAHCFFLTSGAGPA